MTQLENPYAGGGPGAEPAKTSGLAVTSLVCSLLFCCPLITIFGPILGFVSLGKIGGNPALKGRGLALAAIIIGAITTAGGAGVSYFIYQKGKEMMAVMETGPAEALTAATVGDSTLFSAQFYGDGAVATDAEITAFFAELELRYGAFQSAQVLDQSQPAIGQTTITVPYEVVFERATLDCETEIVLSDPNTGGFVFKLGSIRLIDETNGDLTWPPMESAAPSGDQSDGG